MEKYKFLYELSKKALDEELDRYKKLDEKASRFLSILSIGIVAYTALINTAARRVLPLSSAGWGGWVFVILSVVTFVALFSAWFRIFNSLKLADSPRVEIGEDVNALAADKDIVTMYHAMALSCQDAHILARHKLVAKTDWLQSAYKEIQFSTYSLCASVLTYFLLVYD
jgi:hypothetical protein